MTSDVYEATSTPLISSVNFSTSSSSANSIVRKYAYQFDGQGHFQPKEFDLRLSQQNGFFNWYHLEVSRDSSCPAISARSVIELLYPQFKVSDVISLLSSGPFCGILDGALVFRINSTGPMNSFCTFKISAIVTECGIISIALGRIPRLEFSKTFERSLTKDFGFSSHSLGGSSIEHKVIESSDLNAKIAIAEKRERLPSDYPQVFLDDSFLEDLLRKSHSVDSDNPVPTSVAKLLIHIIDTHVEQLQDVIVEMEMQLDTIERDLDDGFNKKKQLLEDRTFAKMHLDLQRLLQSVAHGEVVFPKVKDKLVSKKWTQPDDVSALENLMNKLKRCKENVGFLASRINALQAGLDQWQAEQINRKLYYLSFLSMVFLPLSIVTGAFGMNVGGVPWVVQETDDESILNGFNNVMYICLGIILFMVVIFIATQVKNKFPRLKLHVHNTYPLHSATFKVRSESQVNRSNLV